VAKQASRNHIRDVGFLDACYELNKHPEIVYILLDKYIKCVLYSIQSSSLKEEIMFTINEIKTALESGRFLIGTDLTSGTEIKAVLGMDCTDTENDTILISCMENGSIQWGSTNVTLRAEFEGCGWFTEPDYIWHTVSDTEVLPEGLVLGGYVLDSEEGIDYSSDYRYEQRNYLGLPK